MRFTISESKYENWQNHEYCDISKGRAKPKFANFWNETLVFQTEKKIQKFPKFYNFKNHQISEIAEFQKLANFQNLTICKTIKFSKILNLMVNYHICILTVRII